MSSALWLLSSVGEVGCNLLKEAVAVEVEEQAEEGAKPAEGSWGIRKDAFECCGAAIPQFLPVLVLGHILLLFAFEPPAGAVLRVAAVVLVPTSALFVFGFAPCSFFVGLGLRCGSTLRGRYSRLDERGGDREPGSCSRCKPLRSFLRACRRPQFANLAASQSGAGSGVVGLAVGFNLAEVSALHRVGPLL